MTGLSLPKPSLRERLLSIAVGLGIDAGALLGAALIVFGIDQMHRPSAYIAAGLAVLLLSMLAARRAG